MNIRTPFMYKNAPTIMTGMSIAGLIFSIGSAIYATIEANKIMNAMEEEKEEGVTITTGQKIKVVAPLYIPTVLCAGLTIASSVSSTKILQNRNTVLMATVTAVESASQLYRDKVKEVLSEKQLQKVEEAVAEEQAKDISEDDLEVDDLEEPEEKLIPVFEPETGLEFRASWEKIREVKNTMNERLLTEMFLNLEDLIDEFGIDISAEERYRIPDKGWTVEKGLIDFRGIVKAKGHKRLVVISYRTPPRGDYKFSYY